MKVAVIGCGTIANAAHIPGYLQNKEAEIKYFCDIIPERARKAVARYGCGTAVADYHEVLADAEVEAISVCVPNDRHAPITIDCLRAGKHVLCEKPAARTYAEALTMQEAQRQSGKVLNIGVVNRFNGAVNRIKRMIDQGQLGEVYHVYVSFRAHRSIPGLGGDFTTKAVAGGGALIDWGVHYLDIVMYCLGDPQPVTVSGETFCKLGRDIEGYTCLDMWAGPRKPDGVYDVDDSVTALIRTGGPVLTVHGAWAQNIGEKEQYIDFIGDKAGIRLQYGAGFTLYTSQEGALVTTKPEFTSPDMFNEEIDAFVRCIRTGEKLPCHIDHVIITARMMQAIYDSAEKHREVVL